MYTCAAFNWMVVVTHCYTLNRLQDAHSLSPLTHTHTYIWLLLLLLSYLPGKLTHTDAEMCSTLSTHKHWVRLLCSKLIERSRASVLNMQKTTTTTATCCRKRWIISLIWNRAETTRLEQQMCVLDCASFRRELSLTPQERDKTNGTCNYRQVSGSNKCLDWSPFVVDLIWADSSSDLSVVRLLVFIQETLCKQRVKSLRCAQTCRSSWVPTVAGSNDSPFRSHLMDCD